LSYLAMYRTWRPQRFDEVVGQENTVIALKNAVKEGRLAHAYLFSGPRGTGKTSIAKIVARVVNCEKPIDGEPCNECSACRDIARGSFMDVIEIDAASNRGIDEIRDLREKVRILPAQGKVKVYIVDEVHMLTSEAFNALLKTLEEPPESVMFILATTEFHKIPATICSRCQIFNFRRLNNNEIIKRLREVGIANNLTLTDEALLLMARRASGGLRDALGILDQVTSYKGSIIDKQAVQEVLGLVDDTFLARLMDAVFAQDIGTIVKMLETALHQGKEAQQLAREAALYLRDLLVSMVTRDQTPDLVFVGEEAENHLEIQKGQVTPNQILQSLKVIMAAADKLKFSDNNRFSLEMSFLEIAQIFNQPQPASAGAVETGVRKNLADYERPEKNDAREKLWNQILSGVKKKKIPTHALLSQGKLLGAKDNCIFIGFKKGFRFHKERMEEKANRQIVEEVVRELLKKDVQLEFIFLDDQQYNDIIVKKAIQLFGEDIVEIKE
jgi:DNA polymerase-3 subunit gamma/tau